MELIVGLFLVAGIGWVVWSMLAPPVLFRVSVKNGHVQIIGRLPPHSVTDIEEFFRSNFPSERRLCVTVTAPSSQLHSRIHITGAGTDDEKQLIRNFLLTRI